MDLKFDNTPHFLFVNETDKQNTQAFIKLLNKTDIEDI